MTDSIYYCVNEEPKPGEAAHAEQNQTSALQLDGEEDFLLAPLAIAVGENDPSPPEEASSSLQMDKGWATAFKVNVAVTLVSAIYFGYTAVVLLSKDAASGSSFHRRWHEPRQSYTADSAKDTNEGLRLTICFVGVVVMTAIAGLVSTAMLNSLANCGRGILFSAYWLAAALNGFGALFLACYGSLAASTVLAIFFGLIVYIIHRRRDRIQFGAANLKVAALAIKSMPSTYRVALGMVEAHILWTFIVAVAAVGSFIVLESVTAPNGTSYRAIYCIADMDFDSRDNAAVSSGSGCVCNGEKISNEECEFSGLGFPLLLVWLLSLAWGSAVIKNVVAATVTGSVASWWFAPGEDAAPVNGAFHRATHHAFGSLCKAAVVEKAMHIFHVVMRRVLRFIPCAAFILSWADVAVKYILSYTICFVGIYGLNFSEAMHHVRELFQKRGVTALANDVIVDMGLSLVAISAAILYCVIASTLFVIAFEINIGGLYDDMNGSNFGGADSVRFWGLFGPLIFGSLACVLLISTMLEVLRSGFKAIFVCFVQDPEVLATKHDPELHHELSSAWQKVQINRLCRMARPPAQP